MNEIATVLRCEGVSKTYHEGELETSVFDDVSFTVNEGESVAIIGASGSGKSTLLHILGGLDSVDKGEVIVTGKRMHALSDIERGRLRNRSIGFVYQFHYLMTEFTALENTAMPLLLRDISVAEAEHIAVEMLQRVGLGHRLQHRPGELSGGERQRTAIARALVTQPSVILADEPTGNLDRKRAAQIFELLLQCNQSTGAALVVVTHDVALAQQMDRQLELTDGQLKQV